MRKRDKGQHQCLRDYRAYPGNCGRGRQCDRAGSRLEPAIDASPSEILRGSRQPFECGRPRKCASVARGRGILSVPAFLDAPGVPASHVQRGHTRETGKTETTLPARAAASFRTGRDAPDRFRRGLPGMTMCGRERRAGGLVGHIVKPSTSWRAFSKKGL